MAVTANKQVVVYDLTGGKLVDQHESALKYQTRCVSIFHDNQGYAMGSIEGRVSIEYYNELGLYLISFLHIYIYIYIYIY